MAALFLFYSINQTKPLLADEFCFRPYPPFVSQELFDEFREDIKREFEEYFQSVRSYITCLDASRQAVFAEAKQVSQDYGNLFVGAQ